MSTSRAVWLWGCSFSLALGCSSTVSPFGGGGSGGDGTGNGVSDGGTTTTTNGGSPPINGGAPPTNGGFGSGGEDPVGAGPEGGAGGEEPQGGSPPIECDNLPPAPVAYEQLFGFTSSEDFVFDSLGNYVSIDENSNLVRVTKAGVKTLWIPNVACSGCTAGMAAMPDDSVVFCDVVNGALKRAYPAGNVQTLIGGLNYPNGLDIGPDGYLYVAEDSGGKLRRVHPDTGVSTVVVNLVNPNGVAVTDDPTVIYVGSYNNGLIYKVLQPTPGQPGTSSVFVPANMFEGGGIDGMGWDKCGNIYAAEYISGNVYRITPEGAVTQIADLPSSWIPNIKWGRGVGGWDPEVMYVADRNAASVFALDVQVLGATEYADL